MDTTRFQTNQFSRLVPVWPRHLQRVGGPALSLVFLCLLGLSQGRAQEPEAVGRFIAVPSTITGEAINNIRQAIETDFERFKTAEQQRDRDNPDLKQRRAFKVVYDFNPADKANRSEDFGLCLKLAESIRGLQQKGVQTIAFVHGEVSGHAVLPVLACPVRVFSAKSKLGPVVIDGIAPLEPYQQTAYENLASTPANKALIAKLYDREAIVVPSKKAGFVRANDPEASNKPPVFGAGDLAVFNFAKARDTGLCELDPRENREELARIYRLPRESLHESSLDERVVAWQIPVVGEVNGALREQIERRVRRARANGANFIVFELRCHGGDTAVANQIANDLLDLNRNRPDNPIRTVALVTTDASDTAMFLALGCQHVVMERNAKFGGFSKLLRDRSGDELRAIGDGMEELARRQYYPRKLARGLVDRGVERLFYVVSTKGAREWDILDGRQLDEDRRTRPGHWSEERIDLDAAGFLTLDLNGARKFNLAHPRADDLASLYAEFGVSASAVRVSGSDWLDEMAEFLRSGWTSFLLVMVGITCLILELKLPGIGLPGVIAALCFVLYFWAHSGVAGQATWLAILLFMLGLLLLGVEIFILPGFGICGISGVILLVGSLALVAYGHWPQDTGEWGELTKKVGPVGLGLMGAMVLAVILARYLPLIPFANRLLLQPQSDQELAEPDAAAIANAALLGAIGLAMTPLRPAGKVQFGDQFVDVLAEGTFITPGTRVQVVEVEGNRIVVKPV